MAQIDKEEPPRQQIAQRTPTAELHDRPSLLVLLVWAGSREHYQHDCSEDRHHDSEQLLISQRREIAGDPSALLTSLRSGRSALAPHDLLLLAGPADQQLGGGLVELAVDPLQQLLLRVRPLVVPRMGDDENALGSMLLQFVADRRHRIGVADLPTRVQTGRAQRLE